MDYVTDSVVSYVRISNFLGKGTSGGMLLLISSLSMLNAEPAESKTNKDEIRATEVKASLGASIAVVPLTIPLLTGPATMSTVVIFADRTQHVWELAMNPGWPLGRRP